MTGILVTLAGSFITVIVLVRANSNGRCNTFNLEVLFRTATGMGLGANGATIDDVAWKTRCQSIENETLILEMHCCGNEK